ncbi:alpha-L-fucosidase [Faecalicatena orotica]|uniref:alpha-L-fucosidase n=2 Tax=Faecalicatena orotica TaxID=1544 RepID=A0A2Y9BHD0_9FIRM|nr:alpha-L-fucosidase [Faecalicatena orotica]SSA56276.1 alpha-L-fucosidase [Faecalicatena orotica]
MKDTRQKWFKDAKYGLFIHWGLYSLLGGEHKGQKTEHIAEWIMNYLDIPAEEYRELAKSFRGENFSAEDIVRRAKEEWGMQYLVFTSKHHEGFAMWDSKCSDYNVVKASPYGKDVLKEFQLACRKYGMKFCLYYSQAQDWDDPDGYAYGKDNSHKNFRKYMDNKCIPQLKELLTEYGEISILWFDTPMDMKEEESRELIELVKSYQPACIISGRIGNGLGEYLSTGDNFIPRLTYEGDWEVPATLNDTWGFNKDDENWKEPDDILRLLLKIVSRGGNYLLNIGPDGTGKVPERSCEILSEVGKYVRENAEAIFGTKRVDLYPYDLEWAQLTRKDHKLYVHVLRPQMRIELLNVANRVKGAYLVRDGQKLVCRARKICEGDSMVEVDLPADLKRGRKYAVCIELEEEEPIFEPIRG